MKDLYWLNEADYSTERRKELAKQGHAMPDGSYPIDNVADLEKAIKAYGRAKNKTAVKAFIIKRARALGSVKLLPATWKITEADGTPDESLDQQREDVQSAWYAYTKANPLLSCDSWANEIFTDHVIVRMGEDNYSIPYEDTGDGIVFDVSAGTKVVRQWVTVEADGSDWLIGPVSEADAVEPDGSVWDVVIIKSGTSKNRRRYTAAVLKEAAPLFEGARVLARSDEEHISGAGKSVEKIVGWLSDVTYSRGAIRGRLNISEAASWLRTMLLDAWQRGKKDLVGLSIVAAGRGKSVNEGGKRLFEVEAITQVSSVDVVFDPAAGGGLVKLVAAEGKEESVGLKMLIAALTRGDFATIKALLKESSDDELSELKDELKEAAPELVSKLDEALKEPDPKQDPTPEPAKLKEGEGAEPEEEPEDLVSKQLSRFVVREALAETKLPEPVQRRITKRFVGREFPEAELTEAIADELETWKDLEKANLVARSAGTGRDDVQVGLEEADRAKAALDGFFLNEAVEIEGEKIPPYRSFKQAYMQLTGDGLGTGLLTGRIPSKPAGKLGISEANQGKVKVKRMVVEATEQGSWDFVEAITVATFDQILADSVTRAMVREYQRSELGSWRVISDVVNVNDFRTQRRTRFGGYGNLPAVAAGAAYGALTSPTDEEATYAASKRGGTETINLEAIANDDIGAIRRIPTRLARAAAQTLHEFVFDFLRTNGAIYDSVALFHATHNNLGSTALSTASLSAALQRVRKQAEKDSTKRLGFIGRHLFVPIELEETAYVLTASDRKQGTTDNDANFVSSKGIDYYVVDYLSDANDWFLAADKADVPEIEVGFYGPEDPEIFSQDMPNVGTMFTNDQVTLKIRHIYGGAVVDFRGLDGSVVA